MGRFPEASVSIFRENVIMHKVNLWKELAQAWCGQDELFILYKGHLTIQLRDRDIELYEDEMLIVSKGIEHCPKAEEEVEFLIVGLNVTPDAAGGKPDYWLGYLDGLSTGEYGRFCSTYRAASLTFPSCLCCRGSLGVLILSLVIFIKTGRDSPFG